MENGFFAAADGARLHYCAWGAGEDTLLLLPGMGHEGRSMAAVAGAAAEAGFRAVAPDWRGHGLSELTEGGWSIDAFARDVRSLLESLGAQRFYLLAHSMGNAVAWRFTELFGQEMIRKYVLAEQSPCLMSTPEWSEAERLSLRGRREWPPEMSERSRQIMFAGRDALADKMAALYRDHVSRDWRGTVGSLRVPTLLVFARESHFGASELWDYMLRSIPGSRLLTLEGGHDVHLERGEELGRAAVSFFRE